MSKKHPVTYIQNGVEVTPHGQSIEEANRLSPEQHRIQELEAQLRRAQDERDAEQKRVAELEKLVKAQIADDKKDKAQK